MLEINTADPSATVYSRLFWCLLWWNMQTPSPLIPWTSPRTNQWWPRRPNQWSPAIWRGGNKEATMGQKNAQVKFTVVITIVQAVIAVFFGMFVRWRYVFSSILCFLMLLAPGGESWICHFSGLIILNLFWKVRSLCGFSSHWEQNQESRVRRNPWPISKWEWFSI